MSFRAYILQCADGSHYTATDNLEARLDIHASGVMRSYTSRRLSVELVWSEEFVTRLEATEAEQRIKRWSRVKKEALIAGDWAKLVELSRERTKLVLGLLTEQSIPNTVGPELVEGASADGRSSVAVSRAFDVRAC